MLLLTKPLGTGIISTALKFERAPAAAIAAAIRSMTTLNRAGGRGAAGLPAGRRARMHRRHGFGLVGHASEMAAASRCTLELETGAIPLLPGVRALVQGNVPGGGRTNAQHFGPGARISPDLDPELVQLLSTRRLRAGCSSRSIPTMPERLPTLCSPPGFPASGLAGCSRRPALAS